MALRHEKRLLQKSEIKLGREGTSQAANFPELRNEIVALKKLEQEQKEVALRIAQIEEGIKRIEEQRQQIAREQSEAMAKLEAEKKPILQKRNEAKSAAELCERELASVERRIQENEAADRDLLKKLSELQALDPAPADLEAQFAGIGARRARLPDERAELVRARLGSADAVRTAKEKLTTAEEELAAIEKNIAQVRGANTKRATQICREHSRATGSSSRSAQQHQTVEERKNPAYLNIGRHLGCKGNCAAERAASAGGGSTSQQRSICSKAPGRAGAALQPDRQTGAAEVLFQRVFGARPAGDHVAACFSIAAKTRMVAAGNRHNPLD